MGNLEDGHSRCDLAVKAHERAVEILDLSDAGSYECLAAISFTFWCWLISNILTTRMGYVIHSVKISNHSRVRRLENAFVDSTVKPPRTTGQSQSYRS